MVLLFCGIYDCKFLKIYIFVEFWRIFIRQNSTCRENQWLSFAFAARRIHDLKYDMIGDDIL